MLPHRGQFGAARPASLSRLALPPQSLPSHQRLRPLKAWRYVGIFADETMMCVGSVRIGPVHQSFWAIWDRKRRRLHERTTLGHGRVRLTPGRAEVLAPGVALDLHLDELPGIECVCPSGESYAWTRKQGGIGVSGRLLLGDQVRKIKAHAIIDDTAAYYERHTSWRWSAGVGEGVDGEAVAWNLVSGVNDPPQNSERAVWVDGESYEPPPSRFAADLGAVDGLCFSCEAVRERRENLLLVRSRYRQPFGTFSGRLPAGPELAAGAGVMEEHEVWW